MSILTKIPALTLLLLLPYLACSQELYPLTEPASSVPKGVIGLRSINVSYTDPGAHFRIMNGLRILYGISSKLTVLATATASNHHSKDLPPSFPDHNTPQTNIALPYRFNGINLYAKYRFFTKDAEKRHFRMAAYAEYGFMKVPHDEAEPNLMEDTRGFGAGWIGTFLYDRFAVSATGGFILPGNYKGEVPDFLPGLPGVPAEVQYGKAINYSLSMGYRLWPRQYTGGYHQPNFNVYLEFMGKRHNASRVFLESIGQPGTAYELSGAGAVVLGKNYYLDVHPGIQLILNSNLRLDAAIGLPMIRKSYAHYYPMYMAGIQYYFF